MSDSDRRLKPSSSSAAAEPAADEIPQLPAAARYALALLFVALATVLAFVVENLLAAPNLTLIYVLPVMIAAIAFGWGPALVATAASVLAFDFFFTEPKYSFVIASPSDLWAAALLLIVAAIVSTLAATARQRAVEARRASEQAQALQGLAQVIIQERPPREVLDAAATALSEIFQAPAVIFMQRDGSLRPVGSAGRAKITAAEDEAARGRSRIAAAGARRALSLFRVRVRLLARRRRDRRRHRAGRELRRLGARSARGSGTSRGSRRRLSGGRPRAQGFGTEPPGVTGPSRPPAAPVRRP